MAAGALAVPLFEVLSRTKYLVSGNVAHSKNDHKVMFCRIDIYVRPFR